MKIALGKRYFRPDNKMTQQNPFSILKSSNRHINKVDININIREVWSNNNCNHFRPSFMFNKCYFQTIKLVSRYFYAFLLK